MKEKLQPGRIIEGIKTIAGGLSGSDLGHPVGFIEFPARPSNISRPECHGWCKTGRKISAFLSGLHASTHRNFVWLPYVPGKISFVRSTSLDVFSGDMTGCWIVRFLLDGQPCIGHIGTYDTPSSPLSLQVKNAWREAIAGGRVKLFSAYDPVANLPPEALCSSDLELVSYFALVEKSGAFSTVAMARDLTSEFDDRWCVVGIYPMRATSFVGLC